MNAFLFFSTRIEFELIFCHLQKKKNYHCTEKKNSTLDKVNFKPQSVMSGTCPHGSVANFFQNWILILEGINSSAGKRSRRLTECRASLSNHLILLSLLLLPSSFPSIRVYSNELALRIRWPKYWKFTFSINSSSEYSGLISFRIDWFDSLAVGGI